MLLAGQKRKRGERKGLEVTGGQRKGGESMWSMEMKAEGSSIKLIGKIIWLGDPKPTRNLYFIVLWLVELVLAGLGWLWTGLG